MVGVDGYFLEVLIPGFARIETKLIVRFTKQGIPGALDVIGGKGLAIVPFDAVMQAETQLGFRRVP